ncbi:MAG: molybdenum cofactor biosynthesis protein MoaE, partial [Nocardioidaceae bacterium]
MGDAVRLVALSEEPLEVATAYDVVRAGAAGGVAVFVGTVRELDGGKRVRRLDYTAHPTAAGVLREVVDEVVTSHDVVAVAAVHRVGELEVGDVAVVVAVSCTHRGDAFTACRALIDQLKHRVPIWKHQLFA